MEDDRKPAEREEKTEHDRRKEKAESSKDDPPRNGQGQDLTIPGTPANPDSHTR